MPKLKTHKATAKRIKKTPTGKLLRGHAFSNHFLRKKSAARKRSYSVVNEVTGSVKKSVNKNLGK